MSEHPIDTIELDNGLTLEILDESRRVAGDRWQVKLLARIVIPVEARWFSRRLPAPADMAELVRLLGSHVQFEYRDERQFVDITEKDDIINALASGIRSHADRYYGHPLFAGRCISRRYTEKLRFQTIRPDGPGM